MMNNFQQASPESQGIASSGILRFIEAVESKVREFHSFMLLRHGKLVAQGWWSPYRRENVHSMFSLSKSFTSTAIGFAVDEGLLSLDDFVTSHFPDDLPPAPNENLKALRVRHLLSMSTGHEIDTMGAMFEREDLNLTKGFFTVPFKREPGTHFFYNTGATYILSALLQKLTGQTLLEYLEPRLFKPLKITGARWDSCPRGINFGGFGMSARTEDVASLGQLYLQKGIWQDKHILSEAWVEQATGFQVSNSDFGQGDWAQGYGFQFWRCQHDAYRGDGAFGQYCIVMPEQDAVLAITGGMPDMQVPLTIVWDTLLPAMKDKPLPEDKAAYEALQSKLANLKFEPVQGKSSSAITGKAYGFESNEMGIENIRFEFEEGSCKVIVHTNAFDEALVAAYGAWQAGESMLLRDFDFMTPFKYVASAAWQSESQLKMLVRLYETPFVREFFFNFGDEELAIETRVNVGFGPIETLRLVGKTSEYSD